MELSKKYQKAIILAEKFLDGTGWDKRHSKINVVSQPQTLFKKSSREFFWIEDAFLTESSTELLIHCIDIDYKDNKIASQLGIYLEGNGFRVICQQHNYFMF